LDGIGFEFEQVADDPSGNAVQDEQFNHLS
jgi:hypothetical protein